MNNGRRFFINEEFDLEGLLLLDCERGLIPRLLAMISSRSGAYLDARICWFTLEAISRLLCRPVSSELQLVSVKSVYII